MKFACTICSGEAGTVSSGSDGEFVCMPQAHPHGWGMDAGLEIEVRMKW